MDGGTDSGEITGWLEQWSHGDPAALDRLAPLVYDQLRAIADNLLRSEAADHTLQPTALVSETFLKLLDAPQGFAERPVAFFRFRGPADAARTDRSRPARKSGQALFARACFRSTRSWAGRDQSTNSRSI